MKKGKQTQFTPQGTIKKIKPPKPEVKVEFTEQNKVTCPFCLYTDYISAFYIKLKHGKVSEKRFKCPDCGEIMRKATLTRKMTIEEFAEWIYATHQWDRIKFDKFRERLKEYGISYKFWTAYKQTKEQAEGAESYQDYLARKQREWAKEEGLI